MREVICLINQGGGVRFGLAQFRLRGDGDPHGGFVSVRISDYRAELQPERSDQFYNDITSDRRPRDETWTPLGESLFQMYTYFMSRTSSNRPFGKDGVTRFPAYAYRESARGLHHHLRAARPGAVPLPEELRDRGDGRRADPGRLRHLRRE